MEDYKIYTNLNLINFLITSGILQGFILSVVLFFRKTENQSSARFLSAVLFCINLHLANLILIDLGFEIRFPWLLWLPTSFLTAVGPLIFFYVKSRVNPGFRYSKKDSIHFIPTLFELLIHVVQVYYSIQNNVLYYHNPLYLYFSVILYTSAGISIYHYLKISIRSIRKYEKSIIENFSNLRGITLNWLYRLMYYFRIVWLCWFFFMVIFLPTFQLQINHKIFAFVLYTLIIGITYLTYWIGLEGIVRTDFLYNKLPVLSTGNTGHYSKMAKQKIEGYRDRIEQLMVQEKLFLDENLSLRKLSQKLEAEPNFISYILNNYLGKNFYEYINFYRVEEVKKRIQDPRFSKYTLTAIAYDCGFNSKATFNRVFKKIVGLSPSAFKKQ